MKESDKKTDRLPLEKDKILSIIMPNGLLSHALNGFESRQEQQKMLENIVDAYNLNKIALIEAGTGTGKSIAYLLPAIMWAIKQKERTVISTNTINLQEQLFEKDIPLLLNALKVNIKVVIVKGMSNYLCLRRFQEAVEELPLLSEDEQREVKKLESWKGNTAFGSRSEVPFPILNTTWDKVCVEADTCNRNQCPFYQNCYLFKARREANEAQILIVNHHLLFADLKVRAENENYTAPAILPSYTRLVLDEAHNIEDVATDYFADTVSYVEVMRLLARLTSEKNNNAFGKLPQLKNKLVEYFGKRGLTSEVQGIVQRLSIMLPIDKRSLLTMAGDVFFKINEFAKGIGTARSTAEGQGDSKKRIRSAQLKSELWQQSNLPDIKQLMVESKRFIQSIYSALKEIENLKEDKLNESISSIVFDVKALAMRFEKFCIKFEKFIQEEENLNRVRWIETQKWKGMENAILINADLNISNFLAEYLFSRFQTVVLCSATLSTDKKFDFIRSRLGLIPDKLNQKEVHENIYESPFNFAQQALLVVPSDIPQPDDPRFIQVASEKILEALQISQGNAFVLFTSYSMLLSCYNKLSDRLTAQRFHVFKQGDEDRRILLQKFKQAERSVLFGTDSFWEGVDVAGEALRCVIIVKLPFKVPDEPIIQARSEEITNRGGNPFMEYFVPNAIVKFKQGFGRLIRKKKDRGCVLCLDSRLMSKNYGRLFINSLPSCQKIHEPSDSIREKMIKFYKDTHYLTKN